MFNLLNKKKNELLATTKISDFILFENLKKDRLKITNETINLARKGDMRAQFLVGNEYYHNNNKADYLKALEWYYKSAVNGYANAQCSLGYMYYTGNEAIPADKQLAVQWYSIAASQGDSGAAQMVQHLNTQGFYAYRNQLENEEEKSMNTTNIEKVIYYDKSAPNEPLHDDQYEKTIIKENDTVYEETIKEEKDKEGDELKRLKSENKYLLEQHQKDQQEKQALLERIKYLEEQVVSSLKDEIQTLMIHNDTHKDLCYSSPDEDNHDLNYDTPEE